MRSQRLLSLFLIVAVALIIPVSVMSQDHPAQNNKILHEGLSEVNLIGIEVTKGETRNGFAHWNVEAVLSKPAPAGGVKITLASDPVGAAAVPASMTVPEGETTATIAVGANPLATEGAAIWGNYGQTQHGEIPIEPPVSYDEIIDRIVKNEQNFVASLKTVHPLVETYIQNLRENKEHDVQPTSDVYFLERMTLNDGGIVTPEVFGAKPQKKPGLFSKLTPHISSSLLGTLFTRQFVPSGFAQMTILDTNMQRDNYTFTFVRREFLGEIKTLVFDVKPADAEARGLFTGRIWVEDRDYNIIRFNGTYASGQRGRGVYLHFDSWRSNLQPGLWLPTYVYSEESGDSVANNQTFHSYFFKAQTRIWGYDSDPSKHQTEMTAIKVDDDTVADTQAVRDYSPLESERMWQRDAENNALDHLQKEGLLAPIGAVDKVLTTVVNNIIATNNLDIPEVRCRVLLTTPIESFTIGNTIVVSRGLIDVLPDEAALAAMLSHELAHIALGHRVDTRFAFNDSMFFADQNTFQRVSFVRNPLDEAAANTKAEELLANSPYKDKLGEAGLFLKALSTRTAILPNLIRPHLGNATDTKKGNAKMASLMITAPQLEEKSLSQTAALPLGSRVKLNSWDGNVSMLSFKAVTKLSAQDKMAFEVAPMYVYVARVE